jgi:hypothetical protein
VGALEERVKCCGDLPGTGSEEQDGRSASCDARVRRGGGRPVATARTGYSFRAGASGTGLSGEGRKQGVELPLHGERAADQERHRGSDRGSLAAAGCSTQRSSVPVARRRSTRACSTPFASPPLMRHCHPRSREWTRRSSCRWLFRRKGTRAHSQSPASEGKRLWIRARGTVPLWSMDRLALLESSSRFSRPLPILGVRACDGAVWPDALSSLSKASRQTVVAIPALAGVRAFARWPRGCAGRVAERAENVDPAASSRCHASWQSMAVHVSARRPLAAKMYPTGRGCPGFRDSQASDADGIGIGPVPHPGTVWNGVRRVAGTPTGTSRARSPASAACSGPRGPSSP